MPDDELLRLAADNKLHLPKTLQDQVRRMIADPKAMGFVNNFAGQWLQVCDFDKTVTDRYAYKAYNDDLQKSSWQEPYEFFRTVLRDDLSIVNFVDSDFVVIDPQLALHYGIDGVKGDGFRKVAVRPEDHRGGVWVAGADLLTDLDAAGARRGLRGSTRCGTSRRSRPPNVGDLPR